MLKIIQTKKQEFSSIFQNTTPNPHPTALNYRKMNSSTLTKAIYVAAIFTIVNASTTTTHENRNLGMFNDTPAGYRFPKWVQIVTFVILCLIIIISIVGIILFSKNRAGPPRINEQIYHELAVRQGNLVDPRFMMMDPTQSGMNGMRAQQ